MRWVGAIAPLAMTAAIAAFAATQLPRDRDWAAPSLAVQIVVLVALVATVFALGL